jgi:hypothetical protein
MADQPGDIYQLRMVVLDQNQDQNNNVFYYYDELGPGGSLSAAQALAEAFQSEMTPILRGLLSDEANIDFIEVTNLFDADVLWTEPIEESGSQSGDVATNFTSLSYRTTRVRRDIRRGFKRFGPIPASFILDGEPNPASQTTFDAGATYLGQSITDPTESNIYVPVIVKRIPYTTPSGRAGYRLPATQAEAEWFVASEWDFRGITTQNSRKR